METSVELALVGAPLSAKQGIQKNSQLDFLWKIRVIEAGGLLFVILRSCLLN